MEVAIPITAVMPENILHVLVLKFSYADKIAYFHSLGLFCGVIYLLLLAGFRFSG